MIIELAFAVSFGIHRVIKKKTEPAAIIIIVRKESALIAVLLLLGPTMAGLLDI